MEQKELSNIILMALDNALANIHTSTIVRIERVKQKTLDCQPVINRIVNGESKELPLCLDVPPIIMQGGGNYHVHPIKPGNYGILVIMERCYDRWFNGQDLQPPLELRMHDMSDGFVIVGINPLAGLIDIPTGNESILNGAQRIKGPLYVEGSIYATEEVTAKADSAESVTVTGHTHTGNLGAPTSSPTPGT